MAVLVFPAIAAQQPTTNQATVAVETNAAGQVYAPMTRGGFLEHLDDQICGGVFEPGSPPADEKGFRSDVIKALKELKVSVIRRPGGCFVDAYHRQKGVGKNRRPYGDPHWGVIESDAFGPHEFVELCRRIGAEPYICHHGPADFQEDVGWVAYCSGIEGVLPLERRPGVDGMAIRQQFPGLRMVGHYNKMVMPDGEEARRTEFERLLPLIKTGRFIPGVDHQIAPGVSLEN